MFYIASCVKKQVKTIFDDKHKYIMINFNSIGSGVSELRVDENRHLPLTGGIALTTAYALMSYPVIQCTAS